MYQVHATAIFVHEYVTTAKGRQDSYQMVFLGGSSFLKSSVRGCQEQIDHTVQSEAASTSRDYTAETWNENEMLMKAIDLRIHEVESSIELLYTAMDGRLC